MARTQVCSDARHANGDLAVGSTVAFYTDLAGTVPAVLYANADDAQTLANPATVDEDGYITFWTEDTALYFLAENDDTVRPLATTGGGSTVIPSTAAFNVLDYGAVGDGVTDDYAACNLALQAAITAGSGTVLFPGGRTYYLTDRLTMPRTNTGVIAFSGYGATVKPCRYGFIYLTPGTDYVYHDLLVEGFRIDGSVMAAAAGHSAVIGCRQTNGSYGTPLDQCYYNITVRDMVFENLDDYTVKYLRYGISLCTISASGGGAGTYMHDMVFENIVMYDGSCLLELYGGVDGSGHAPDIYIDRVAVTNCHHIRPQRAYVGGADKRGNSFHIGGYSYGGIVTYTSCSSVACFENGFETNSVHNVNYIGCFVRDARLCAFYMTNFNDLVDPDSQAINHIGCRVERTYAGGFSHYCRGWTGHGDYNQVGNFLIEGCSYAQTVGDLPPRVVYQGYSSHIYGPKKLIIRDFVLDAVVADSISSTNTRYIFQIEDGALADGSVAEVILENVVMNISGTVTVSSSSYDYYLVPFYLDHPKLSLKIDGLRFRAAITPSQGDFFVRPLFYFSYTGQEVSAAVRRLVWEYDNCTAAPYAFQFASATDVVPVFIVEDCDWRGMSVATSRYISPSTSLGVFNQKMRTRERNCAYASAPAGTTITAKATLTINAISAAAAAEVTTSAAHGLAIGDWVYISGTNSTPVLNGWRQVTTVPSTTKFTVAVTTSDTGNAGSAQPAYTNKLYHDQDVAVSGGTVSKIELSTDFGATWTDVGLTSGLFRLRGGDSICVTNSSAPTMKGVPRP